MQKTLLFTMLLMVASTISYAQSAGIRGTISDEKGEPLPFATIYIRNLSTGTSSNVEGYFEYALPAGKYDLVFRYIGYESIVSFVEVSDGFKTLDIKLKSQAIVLKNVEVRAGKEDPAYSIIRKAIAKSKFHTQQLDAYNARVYMKGSGRVIDVPFFLRKAMEKEGVDSTMAFTSESVSVIEYERPNKITQRVLAVHSQGDDNGTGPEEFLTGSFYQPEVNGAISPLSPRAFSYYRFGYEGAFEEGDYVINKIQVTPRSRGDNVFEGTIYIVDKLWSIHSLDLTTSEFGMEFRVKQLLSPIDNTAWLPINYKIDVRGSFMGVEFEYDYLATLSSYEITINPELTAQIEVIDEKVDKEEAEKAEIKERANDELIRQLNSKKELTRKDLRKALKEYEKQELEETEFPDVISNVTLKKDSSTIYNNDSVYWSVVRSVPLTDYEMKGYKKMDEFEEKEKEEAKKDSVKQRTFRLYDLVLGNSYKLGKESKLIVKSPLPTLSFNAVEGYHFDYEFYYRKTLKEKYSFQLGPVLHYSFARRNLMAKIKARYSRGKGYKRDRFSFESGRSVSQLNAEEPIHPYVNSFTALVLEENYIKLYQKDFARINYKTGIRENLSVHVSLDYEDRKMLSNNSSHTWFDRKNKEYASNTPLNKEIATTEFDNHQAVRAFVGLTMKPWQKYKIVDGIRRPVDDSSPTFRLNYTKGINNILSSDVDYDLVSAGVDHSFDLGIRNKIDVKLEAGTFVNNNALTFVDFKHFLGNQTPFSTTDPSKSFRFLNYYRYSTKDAYLTLHLHDQFRKLLITRLPLVRAIGIKENLFVNYLSTSGSDNYTELGYGLDNIFRVFRLETVTIWQNGKFEDYGFRIGIATNLDDLFQ